MKSEAQSLTVFNGTGNRETVIKTKDQTLADELVAGDENALDELIETEKTYLTAVVRRIIGSCMTEQDVEEVVQDAFMSLWTSARRLDLSKASIRTYLIAIARNGAKNKMRSLRPAESPLTDLVEDAIYLKEPAEVSINYQKEILEIALLRLEPLTRCIFIRHYYLYESVEEIGKLLSMRPSTVKSRLRRGRKKLKAVLNDMGYQCMDDIGL